uniref:Velvet domain-containing protein n=1 Tax=Kwoniella dejecticola CBS 10117 TaxID=1296121 RepID=A0A1A6A6H7_9TREE|nr:uncharacterized protein I303_03372 [Kwoniella dejecticola CBS 10117]OBR85661.1 hypothetical protein I303_03372 [Kwoniella dejecticola CBS 10117]
MGPNRTPSSRSTLQPGVSDHTATGSNEGPSYPHILRGYIPVTEMMITPQADRLSSVHIERDIEGNTYPTTRVQASRAPQYQTLPENVTPTGRSEFRGTRIIHPPPQGFGTPRSRGQDERQPVSIPVTISSPPPPAENLPSIGSINLSGYQTDYTRVNGEENLRRAPNSAAIRATAQLHPDETNLPVPAEAYVLIRPHRVPENGWNDGIAQEMLDAKDWVWELHLIQQPIRGKALGLGDLPRGWPALSAPLIVQLIVRDRNGREIPVDHPILNRKLVHTSMMVDLVSEDGQDSRSFMRVREKVEGTNNLINPITHNYPENEFFSRTQRNLLGSLHRSANTYVLNGKRGIYFLFTELVVRNVGRFALKVSLLDLAGSVTSLSGRTISTALTHPFTVYHATQFPGALPVTDLSMEFTRQGERNLGRRTRADNNGVSSEDDLLYRASGSPEVQVELTAPPPPAAARGDFAHDQGQTSPTRLPDDTVYILPDGRRLREIPRDPKADQGQDQGQGRRGGDSAPGFERSHL